MPDIKILCLDLETSPIKSHHWKLWMENIGINQIIEESYIMSWAAKWMSGDEVMYMDIRIKGEKAMLNALIQHVKEADMVIAHNGKAFDIKVMNYRAAIHGLYIPERYRMVDTLKVAKKYFRLPSYKLEYLCNVFNKGYKKLAHSEFPGFELWKECLAGNEKAWQCMEEYNKHDVLALEELYASTLVNWDVQTHKWLVKQGIGIEL